MRRAALLCSLAVAGLLAAACGGGKGTVSDGGGGAGAGGRGGSDDLYPPPCPVKPPKPGDPCEWATCGYNDGCRCIGCCGTIYSCVDGKVDDGEVVDYCPPNCEGFGGAGTGGGGIGGNGGLGGTGGAAAGGASGSGGAPAPLTTCPTARPPVGASCTGSFSCDFTNSCSCGGCCSSTYQCTNDALKFVGFTDDCMRACDGGTN